MQIAQSNSEAQDAWFQPAVRKPECVASRKNAGIFSHWNSTSGFTDRPVFRFDGRFVCSVLRIAAGGHHSCLIYGDAKCTNCNDGYMECVGWDAYNQSTVPQCMDASEPSRVEELGVDTVACDNGSPPMLFRNVSAGLFHTCAITTLDQLVCWGDNRSGQLGNMVVREVVEAPPQKTHDGSKIKASNVAKEQRFSDVCAGAYHTCVVRLGMCVCVCV